MKKIMTVFLSLLITGTFLMGCGQNEMAELSEEQQTQVAEYAAGLLLKYASNYHSRLVDSEEELIALADKRAHKEELQAKANAMKQQEAQKEQTVESSNAQGAGVVDMSGDSAANVTMGNVLDTVSVTITYNGYELLDSYPEESEDDYVFAMDATQGNKLLVMHFTMTNITTESTEVDIASTGCRFLCKVNGESYHNVLTTMLLNDLAVYKGTVDAGTSQDVVLVLEVPEDTQIQSLELLMKKGAQQVKMLLE